MNVIAELQLLPGVLYAMALGGAIGYERELKNRPAGFRTHMLVAGTAALLLGLSRFVLEHERYAGQGLQIDPLRLVEAVIAGVSFIGAGTIFASRNGRGVEGITTAASLLMVAAIGITVGFRYYVLALAVTLLALGVLTVLRWLERRPGHDDIAGGQPPPSESGNATGHPNATGAAIAPHGRDP